MKISMQDGNYGKAIFHPKDVSFFGIRQNELVKIIDEDSSSYAILTTFISEKAYQDTCLGDPNILNNIGIQDGAIVDIEPFQGEIVFADKVKIEFSTIDTNPRDFFKKNNIEKLKQFLKNYYFLQTTEILWPEQSASLRIKIVEPKLEPNEICKIPDSCEINLMEEVQNMPFNAILLIDHSRSMTRYDVNIKGVENTLVELENRLLRGTNFSRNSALARLFARLKKNFSNNQEKKWVTRGENVKEVTKRRGASRIDSVLLATLLFFQLKISRGYGEKCVFISYADDAKPIPLGNGKKNNIIEANEFNGDLCNALIQKIKDNNFMRWGNTNISSAFKYCKKIALDLKRDFNSYKPIMILLLTDGRPHPREIDNPQNLLDTIFNLKETLEEQDIPFIVYAIGIGDETKEKSAKTLLTRVAKAGNGAYHYVSEVEDLISWYQRLATNFSYKISQDNINPTI